MGKRKRRHIQKLRRLRAEAAKNATLGQENSVMQEALKEIKPPEVTLEVKTETKETIVNEINTETTKTPVAQAKRTTRKTTAKKKAPKRAPRKTTARKTSSTNSSK